MPKNLEKGSQMDELGEALRAYERLVERAADLSHKRSRQNRLVRDLLMILEFHLGRKALLGLLEREGLTRLAAPFIDRERSHSAGTALTART